MGFRPPSSRLQGTRFRPASSPMGPAHGGGPGEANFLVEALVHAAPRGPAAAGPALAVHHVHHPRRQPGVHHGPHQQVGGGGGVHRRLPHHGVAAQQGGDELPAGAARGELSAGQHGATPRGRRWLMAAGSVRPGEGPPSGCGPAPRNRRQRSMVSCTSARASRGGLPTSRVITAASLVLVPARHLADPARSGRPGRAGGRRAPGAAGPRPRPWRPGPRPALPHSGKMPTVSRVSTADLASKEGRSPSTSLPPIQLNPITVLPWLRDRGGIRLQMHEHLRMEISGYPPDGGFAADSWHGGFTLGPARPLDSERKQGRLGRSEA